MADRKISDLTALTTPASGDFLPIVDISEAAAASKNKKITYSDFLNNIPTGTITSTMILDGTILNADINASAAIVDTKLATIATGGKVSNSATTATDANTASAIVARDASGNFSAGTITAALTGAASSNVLKAGDTMTGALVHPLGAAATPSLTFTGDLNTGIWSPSADAVAASTAGNERLRITSAGLVGIGTSSPGSEFEIADTTGYVEQRFRRGSGTNDWAGIGLGATAFSFQTRDSTPISFATNATTRAVIDSSGRVGIGTSAPNSPFEVGIAGINLDGAIAALPAAGADSAAFIARTASTGSAPFDQAGSIIYRPRVSSTAGRSSHIFYTGSPSTIRMVIDETGVVAIGAVSNTNYRLNIPYLLNNKGCVYLENFAYYSSQHALVINDKDTNAARTMSDVRFERNGVEVGFIRINSSSVTYSTTSDYRVKENIVSLTGAIERIKQLQVKRFNFISYPEQAVDGFIAHEAQAVVPEAVSGSKDQTKDLGDIFDDTGKVVAAAVDEPLPEHLQDGHTWTKTHTIDVHQGIDQSKLVPLLTAALQEAIAKIETLEARLTAAGID